MTQTRSRFFDEMGRLMNDAAGVAQGVRREFDTLFRTQAERILRELEVVTREEFEARLRERGKAYHIHHPFNVMLNTGKASPEQVRGWVANRFCYQTAIPVKDAAILANCPDRAVRRGWVQRILDHDGFEMQAGPTVLRDDGGIETWLRLATAVGLTREEVEDGRHVIPAVRFAVDAYVNFARHAPWLLRCRMKTGTETDDGSGIWMGAAAGGATLRMEAGDITLPLFPPVVLKQGIFVNGRGQRFLNEDAYFGRAGEFALLHQAGEVYLVVDEGCFARPEHFPVEVAAVGQTVAKDQGIIELETEKATIAVPSSQAGVVKKILVAVGESVNVGQSLISLEAAAGDKPYISPASRCREEPRHNYRPQPSSPPQPSPPRSPGNRRPPACSMRSIRRKSQQATALTGNRASSCRCSARTAA